MDAVNDFGSFEVLALVELEQSFGRTLALFPITQAGFEKVPGRVEAN